MRSLSLAILGLGGLLALGTAGANAAPLPHAPHAQSQSPTVRANYEWNHHHYRHRHWEHHHWRYWN